MKWIKLFFKPPFKDIIELTREHEQLKKEVENLWFWIYQRKTKKNEDYHYLITPMYKKHNFNYIVDMVTELLKENKTLKEELISKINTEQKQEIHKQDNG